MASPDAVAVERSGETLVVTLNRPEARNAVNRRLAELLGEAMEQLDADEGLRVAVITGADGVFCAGMDLKAFVAGEEVTIEGRGFAGLVEAPPRKPLIAAVEGHAVAGGFEIALACDLIVASRTARFGIPEVRRGLVALGGGLLRLPRRIPYHLAMELALTGRTVGADELRGTGLVSRWTEPGGALDGALELAGEIAAGGPLAVVASKEILGRSGDWGEEEGWVEQRRVGAPVVASEDAREGAVAFAEKRPPVWRGR